MKDLFTINLKYILYQTLLIIVAVLIHYYFYNQSDMTDERIFYIISIVIMLFGLVGGSVLSLGLSLFFIFVLGSYSFWGIFSNGSEISSSFLIKLFLWFTIFIVLSLLSGNFQGFIKGLITENKQMKNQFEELVSIDSQTGFDNRKRFFFELEEEFKRSQRYGNILSILLIQVEYLTDFRKLYGDAETSYIIQKISDQIRETTRVSDKKYRVSDNLFGIMLTHTPHEHVGIVIEKIKKRMTTQSLRDNKREITLTIKFGTGSFEKDVTNYMEMYEIAETELENYTQ